METDYLGIILPRTIYELMPLHLDENYQAMLSIFEETGKKHGITPCYFRFFHIQAGQESMSAYVKQENGYVLKEIPTPKVVYTRVLDLESHFRSHIASLQKSGIKVYNVPNYDVKKYTIHEHLHKTRSLRPYLPHTEILSLHSLKLMMDQYDKLILKLNYGERGIGAMKLEKNEGTWCLSYKLKTSNQLKKVYFIEKIPIILEKRMKTSRYIIQELIPLATYANNPFDMRVAVQKNGNGEFQVSSIICKVAKKDHFLTNGAQGGKTYRLEDIAPDSHPSIPYSSLKHWISAFSLDLAKTLNQTYPHLADLGFDIGVTKTGKPYFIECNFISDYVHGLFKDGQLIFQEFQPVFSTPIAYARYLFNQKK